ncbi:hypothetical protein ACU635_15135 [[Actinomadura] parvosata]|uniref:hypothetical protein n=1 Tax=[Actinomadura] parvosata TaxID=1955412 RepID=UPI00406C2A0B
MTSQRHVLVPMYIGAALTALAALFPFLDRAVLIDHLEASYPAYTPAAIGAAVSAYLVILATVGVLGLAGWLAAIMAARAGRRWAPWLAAGLLVIALGVAVAGLTVRDVSGDVGLAPPLGWLLALPCVPGAVAVALWRRTA